EHARVEPLKGSRVLPIRIQHDKARVWIAVATSGRPPRPRSVERPADQPRDRAGLSCSGIAEDRKVSTEKLVGIDIHRRSRGRRAHTDLDSARLVGAFAFDDRPKLRFCGQQYWVADRR